MDIKKFQEGSYDPVKAAEARALADNGSSAFDSGHFDSALKLWKQALVLKPPLRIEMSILLELADALTEWFTPIASGQRVFQRAEPTQRLELLEKILIRIRELLKVPDPFDIAIEEGWHETGQELVFDPNTYFREDE